MKLSAGQRHMLLATFLFSLMGVLVKHLRHLPPQEVVFFRAAVSLVVCYVLLRRRGVSPWGHRRGLLVARGVVGTAALLLFFHTLQTMPLATAVTVQYLSPIFTLLLSGVLLREPGSSRQWSGFLLAFTGAALVKGFDLRVSGLDLALGVTAAACSALAYNLVRKLRGTDDPLVVVFYFPLVTVPLVGPLTASTWVPPGPWDWVALVAVGLLTQAAQVNLTRAYHLEEASRISHLTYAGSILALLFGFVLFGEAMPPMALAGMGLIVGGVLLCTR